MFENYENFVALKNVNLDFLTLYPNEMGLNWSTCLVNIWKLYCSQIIFSKPR